VLFRSSRLAITLVEKSRWTAYATASAATAAVGIGNAEASIHHVDVNKTFAPAAGMSTISVFALAPGAQISFRGFLHSSGINGHASFGIAVGAGVASFVGTALGPSSRYVSKLGAGLNITGRNFITNAGYFAYIERHNTGQFGSAGIGYIGFKFNTGAGLQYGWAKVNMQGATTNRYTLVDYAWGDVGDTVLTGAVPEPGSLGLLALGGVGLLAWRKRRALAAKR